MVKESRLDQLLFSFVQEIQAFHYAISSLDHIWDVLFPSQDDKWHHIRIVKYMESYMFVDISGNAGELEFPKPEEVRPFYGFERTQPDLWPALIISALAWLKRLRKDWIANSKRVQLEYPLDLRQGIVPHSLIRSSFPEYYRLDVSLGQDKAQKIIDLVENGYLSNSEHTDPKSLTANEYFAYCKIAYIAARREDETVDENLSGRELYRVFADGRDDGLLAIDGDSREEFSTWIDHTHPLREVGGHPDRKSVV